MSGFLRFAFFFLVLLAALVLVVLPLALGPILTGMVRDMGLHAETLDVTVALFDPGLLLGRSRSLHVEAGNVSVANGSVGELSLSFGDASFFDRTFATVSGEVRDVSVVLGNDTIGISAVEVSGPVDAASATARLSAAQAEDLISLTARRQGVTLDSVHVGASGLTVSAQGFEGGATIAVRGGALVLDPGIGGTIVLLQPAPSDPYQLDEAWLTADGLNVRATIDVNRLTRQVRQQVSGTAFGLVGKVGFEPTRRSRGTSS